MANSIPINLKTLARYIFAKLNLGVTTLANFEKLKMESTIGARFDLEFLLSIEQEKVVETLNLLGDSHAQLRQDLFVLNQLNFKHEGFFVEFGATDGISLSNTLLLESKFAWKGILAEPAKSWLSFLMNNRPGSLVDNRCVWKNSTDKVIFRETKVREFSTVEKFESLDSHKYSRRNYTSYPVDSVSLNDLLVQHNAPEIIDYLSIDTEGSEFEILNSFDFSKNRFRIITCEHNFTENRDKIHNLLSINGYSRLFTNLSKWDDWYVDPKLV